MSVGAAMDEQTRQRVRDLVFDEAAFVRLTLSPRPSLAGAHSGPLRTDASAGAEPPAWQRIVVRPVQLRGGRHLQFSYFDARRDVTKNFTGAAAERHLSSVLALPARAVSVQSTHQTLNIQVTKSGKAILHCLAAPTPPPAAAPPLSEAPLPAAPAMEAPLPAAPPLSELPPSAAPDLRHNRRKERPLPEDVPDRLLQGLGIMDQQGRVKPSMQGKFIQVNEFLKLLEHTGLGQPARRPADGPARRPADETAGRRAGVLPSAEGPLRLVDCASGSSYLSFVAHHYLNHVRGIPATLVGVDVNPALVAKGEARVREMGLEGIHFITSAIADYRPDATPDVVLALHACDTATDEALAQAVIWGAKVILAVPCCQHHLNEQVHAVRPFGPVLHHGILKERLADILTDSFRAQILRLAGYDTDVVEFVSTEHSGRNLLIRAVRRQTRQTRVAGARLAEDYAALKAFWGVTPYLEELLRRTAVPAADRPTSSGPTAAESPLLRSGTYFDTLLQRQ